MQIKSISPEDVKRLLPKRKAESHKGDYGRILLLCGSVGYTGAAALSAQGALRCGAGVVYLAVPQSIYSVMSVKLTEPVIVPLPDADGKISRKAPVKIKSILPRMDAVLIGPGLGQGEGVYSAVKEILQTYQGPVIVDADGINVLSRHKDIVRDRKAPTLLTPHWGEFCGICDSISGNRQWDAQTLAADLDATILLKGNKTLVCDRFRCFVNTTGNPGMATGGSGDVLAGMITAFAGQGIDLTEAAALGAYLHGAAGDICAEELGEYAMLPSDMLAVLPRLLK